MSNEDLHSLCVTGNAVPQDEKHPVTWQSDTCIIWNPHRVFSSRSTPFDNRCQLDPPHVVVQRMSSRTITDQTCRVNFAVNRDGDCGADLVDLFVNRLDLRPDGEILAMEQVMRFVNLCIVVIGLIDA
jgi:hypothetical protein